MIPRSGAARQRGSTTLIGQVCSARLRRGARDHLSLAVFTAAGEGATGLGARYDSPVGADWGGGAACRDGSDGARVVHVVTLDETAAACPGCGLVLEDVRDQLLCSPHPTGPRGGRPMDVVVTKPTVRPARPRPVWSRSACRGRCRGRCRRSGPLGVVAPGGNGQVVPAGAAAVGTGRTPPRGHRQRRRR